VLLSCEELIFPPKFMSSVIIEYDNDTKKIAKIDGYTVDEWLAEQDLRANLIPNYDPPLRALRIFELINKEKMNDTP
jgi:hypothetical protein